MHRREKDGVGTNWIAGALRIISLEGSQRRAMAIEGVQVALSDTWLIARAEHRTVAAPE